MTLKLTKKNSYATAYKLFGHEKWDDENECEVAYWRKCWGVRNAILKLYPRDKDEYRFPVTLDNINDIIKTFKYFLSKDRWEREADSIWDWDEYTRRNQIKNLLGLYKLKWWLRGTLTIPHTFMTVTKEEI